MTETFIRVGDVIVHAPVTVATNLALAVQCWLSYRRLRTGRSDRRGLWASFFLAMAIATLTGAFKHGLGDAAEVGWLAVFPWTSNLAAGWAVWWAQRAALAWRPAAPDGVVAKLATVQLMAFLMANVEAGPSMALLVGHAALGLMPVMLSEARARVRASAGGGWISLGLLVSTASGVVYVAALSPGRWLTHVDLAHLFMGVGFALMFRGATRAPVRPRVRARAGVAAFATLRRDG